MIEELLKRNIYTLDRRLNVDKPIPRIYEEVLDIEDLNRVGHKEHACPYYLSRKLVEEADIIFVPYQYLIDKRKRNSLGILWEGSIIIFDEAHNLEVLMLCLYLPLYLKISGNQGTLQVLIILVFCPASLRRSC